MTLTNQQVFDNALNQVRTQGYMRSYNHAMQCCTYRGDHGRKCAVGASIPDNLYDPGIENRAAFALLLSWPYRDLFRHVNSELLSELQRLHDGDLDEQAEGGESISEDEFEAGMMLLASKYSLAYTRP